MADFLTEKPSVSENELADVVGKDLAEKIVAEQGKEVYRDGAPFKLYSGVDLKVGGEGMKAFYDRIVPQVVSDQLKKVGGKMETVGITNEANRYQVEQRRDGVWAVRQDGRAYGPPLNSEDAAQKVADRLNGEMQQPGFTVIPKMSEPLPLFSPRRQTETPEFKAWFGDSKVVDADGKPLVVYHGTPKDFSVFKGKRIWVTSDTELASVYTKEGITEQGSGGNIMPLYVSIKNPKVFSLPDDGLLEWSRSKTDEALARDGHDGVMFIDKDGNIKTAYAFDPTQIKSAIGNNGQFSPTDPDIRRSTARSAATGQPIVASWASPKSRLSTTSFVSCRTS